MSAETTPVGIQNLKKAVKLGIGLSKQGIEAFENGYQWTDLFSFVDELSQIPDLIKSAKQIGAEFANLDASERAELDAYVATEFDIPDDKVEVVIEHSLSIIFSIVALTGELKAAKK